MVAAEVVRETKETKRKNRWGRKKKRKRRKSIWKLPPKINAALRKNSSL